MIELDMELETELGIDSIKRVEILSEVQNMLCIEANNVDALSRTRTVGDVIEAMKLELGSTTTASPKTQTSAAKRSETEPFFSSAFDNNNYELRDKSCTNLNLSYPELLEINPASEDLTNKIGSILVCGGDDWLCQSLSRRFQTSVKRICNKDTEETLKVSIQDTDKFNVFLYIHDQEPIAHALASAKYVRSKLTGDKRQFVVVIRGDGNLGMSGALGSLKDVEDYALCGLVKTIALEWPEVKTKLIDIKKAPKERINDQVVYNLIGNEILDANAMLKEVGYDEDGKRYAMTVKGLISVSDLKLNAIASSNEITKDDVWIVTGGARGITPLCVKELAYKVGGGTYYLFGRSKLKPVPTWAARVVSADEKEIQKAAIAYLKSIGEKPKPVELRKLVNEVVASVEVKENLEAIGKCCNGQVFYVSCDINDKASVEAELKKLPKISGIFHASGVLRDKLIENKDLKDFELVYNTKIRGFENVWNTLISTGSVKSVKHVVMFSSLAGFYGNAGQSDYSMANEVLNKIAYYLKASSYGDLDVKVFDFGPWDGGMVTPELKKHFLQNNVQIIDREAGATSVAKMCVNSAKTQILVGNWGLSAQKPRHNKNEIIQTIKKLDYLVDHSIHGKVVVPFTFNFIQMAQTVVGLYPGYNLKSAKDCRLYRGVTFDQNMFVETKLITEEKVEAVNEIEVEVKMQQRIGDKFAPSYQATFVLTKGISNISTTPLNAETLQKEAKQLEKSDLYETKTLFHGPKFQGMTNIKFINESVCIAKANLATKELEKVPSEALLLDLIFQAGLVFAREMTGKASLPVGIEKAEFATDFFNGSRSFKNMYIILQLDLSSTKSDRDAVWKLNVKIQDDTVLCDAIVGIALNNKLEF